MLNLTTILIVSAALVSLLGTGCSMPNPKPIHDPDFSPVYPQAEAPPLQNGGAIYRLGANTLLFEDLKAHKVGDLLTIILNEKTDASKSSKTSTAKTSNYSVSGPTILGRGITSNGVSLLDGSIDSTSGFDGDGSTQQSNSLETQITVTVAKVLANGNLLVRGEKVMSINDGDEFVRFSGIVRPVDISQDNSVASTKVANAEIIVGGNGTVANAGKAGWLTKVLNSPLWPF